MPALFMTAARKFQRRAWLLPRLAPTCKPPIARLWMVGQRPPSSKCHGPVISLRASTGGCRWAREPFPRRLHQSRRCRPSPSSPGGSAELAKSAPDAICRRCGRSPRRCQYKCRRRHRRPIRCASPCWPWRSSAARRCAPALPEPRFASSPRMRRPPPSFRPQSRKPHGPAQPTGSSESSSISGPPPGRGRTPAARALGAPPRS